MWCPGCTYRACRRMCETPFWPLSRPAPLRRTTGIFWSRRSTLPQASACHTRTRSGSRCEDIGVARPRVGWLISSTAILVHVYFVRYMHVVNICLYLSTYSLSMPPVVAENVVSLLGAAVFTFSHIYYPCHLSLQGNVVGLLGAAVSSGLLAARYPGQPLTALMPPPFPNHRIPRPTISLTKAISKGW